MKINQLKEITVLSIFSLSLLSTHLSAQVTIGNNEDPQSGALLQLKENENINDNSSRGLGMPRVALEAIEKLDPCVPSDDLQSGDLELHIGLIVYNTTDNPAINLCPGLHVWNGEKWIRLHGKCGIDPSLVNSPNCYIVAPGGVSEQIPIAKAYLVSEERSELTALNRTDKISLKILWQDTQNLINKVELVDGDKGILSEFKVTVNNITGNALIALHVGPNGNAENDPRCWSWHIWVTDYNPNNGGTTYTHNNGEKDYTFMDRNLGATTTSDSDPNSMGMTYQWGRKDPFPPNLTFGTHPGFRVIYNAENQEIYEIDELNTETTGTGIQHEEVTEPNNLHKSILNPMIYYYAKADDNDTDDNTADWFTTDDTGASSDNNLWGGVSGKKSPFDPCPAGWKVPAMSSATKSPWALFESSGWGGGAAVIGSTGFTMSGLGFYPYGFPRLPRSIIECVGVGCLGQNYVGGAFVGSGFWNDERGAYWTATASPNNLAAKASGIVGAGSPQPALKNLDYSKAGGAYVRCVRE